MNYLKTPPILVVPTIGDALGLYLSVIDFGTNGVRLKELEKVEKPI